MSQQEQLTPNVFDPNCPSRAVLRHLTDRWTPLIISVLAQKQQLRFTELQHNIGGISAKVLTETLRSLERDGLIIRTVIAAIPPRVDYQLSPLGKTLIEPLQSLCQWAENHMAEVLDNREKFASQKAPRKA